jgi:hypothetical protein
MPPGSRAGFVGAISYWSRRVSKRRAGFEQINMKSAAQGAQSILEEGENPLAFFGSNRIQSQLFPDHLVETGRRELCRCSNRWSIRR